MALDPLYRSVTDLFPLAGSAPTRRVGLEQELITRDADGGSVVRIERVRRVARRAAYAAVLGFEPGGQVELSLPCSPTVTGLGQQWRAAMGALRADCARTGVLLDAVPVDERGEHVPLQLLSPRYACMQQHFERIGPAGRRMMRRTASTQLCLDWWPGAAGLEQWRLMQLAGPFLAASFSRSHGPRSRLATWLAVDPGRTAFDDRLVTGADPIRAYAQFAAAAPAWCPTPAEHLTTLFPPVRPRGRYLEVRHLDVQRDELLAAVASLFATLLYDDECRRSASRVMSGEHTRLAEHWRTAAADPAALMDRGGTLVEIGLEGMSRAPHGYLPPDVGPRLREHLESRDLLGAA